MEKQKNIPVVFREEEIDWDELAGIGILRRRVVKCSNTRCGLVVFREVAGKTLTDTHVEQLFTEGQTEMIRDFRNKAGRKFDAVLVFDEQYRVKFAFPEPPGKKT